MKKIINCIIDWFYPPFRKYIPYTTFRYGACGGANTALDIFLYFVTYNFIVAKQNLIVGPVTIKPHIAAFLLVFPITFLTGFLLAKYITFSHSKLKGGIQLFRYAITVVGSIFLNYILLKLFVEVLGFYPTPSKFLTTAIVVVYSYFAQMRFSFQVKVER